MEENTQTNIITTSMTLIYNSKIINQLKLSTGEKTSAFRGTSCQMHTIQSHRKIWNLWPIDHHEIGIEKENNKKGKTKAMNKDNIISIFRPAGNRNLTLYNFGLSFMVLSKFYVQYFFSSCTASISFVSLWHIPYFPKAININRKGGTLSSLLILFKYIECCSNTHTIFYLARFVLFELLKPNDLLINNTGRMHSLYWFVYVFVCV